MSLKSFRCCLDWGFGCGRVNKSQIATVLLRFVVLSFGQSLSWSSLHRVRLEPCLWAEVPGYSWQKMMRLPKGSLIGMSSPHGCSVILGLAFG
jgi:hypothetical protein